MPTEKAKLLRTLRECAILMEIRGDNAFRCRAYENGARAIEGVEGEPAQWIAEDRLKGVKGVGKGMIDHAREWVENGGLEIHRELKSELPAGLLDMVRIPGLGAKKVKALWRELDIDSIEKLQAAAESGAVAELAGFGKKSAEKILTGIEQRKRFAGRHRADIATASAEAISKLLTGLDAVERFELAGSHRRRRETIKDLDFVVQSERPAEVMDAFVSAPGVMTVVAHGETKSSVVLEDGVPIDLRVVTAEEFAPALNYFTGSKEHNTHLRGLAKKKGLRLNEYGLYPDGKEESLPCPDEESIYRHLGLAYIEPELREDRGEIEAAARGERPELITRADMRGLLHCHSTYSDGKSTLADMAEAARGAGYEYFGICDHSQAAFYAGGLKEADVLRQHAEIDRINAGFENEASTFRIVKGIESDILADGALDYPDEFLARFDFVVCSVHSQFNFKREKMTQRICTALEHPSATILAHPTGRILLRREPYEVDLERVFEVAAANGVAIEINANPQRLDLDWRMIGAARKAGCRFVINPDAHHTSGIAHVDYGIGIARKGALGPGEVINTKTLEQFRAWLAERGQP